MNDNTLNNDEMQGSDVNEADGACRSGSCCSFKMWVLIGIALGLLWYFAN